MNKWTNEKSRAKSHVPPFGMFDYQCNHLSAMNRVSLVIPPCQRSRYATYFDVAVLRCLLQPHWSEEGTQWSLMYYLQRLRHMLEEKPEKLPEPDIPLLPRPRSSSMVAAAPSLVNTHKTQVRETWFIVIWINNCGYNRFSFSSVYPAPTYSSAEYLAGGYCDATNLSLPSFTVGPLGWSLAFNFPFKEVLYEFPFPTLI